MRARYIVALKLGDGTIEWNGLRYADKEALYEAADGIFGQNSQIPLVIVEKCGKGEKIAHEPEGLHSDAGPTPSVECGTVRYRWTGCAEKR